MRKATVPTSGAIARHFKRKDQYRKKPGYWSRFFGRRNTKIRSKRGRL